MQAIHKKQWVGEGSKSYTLFLNVYGGWLEGQGPMKDFFVVGFANSDYLV